ncbi:hypothetical protein K504DRAFT_531124 [Pleomassaria siparia CBS 279.74]|uniref:Helicase C-terminal domain-containing protein n=1 Tax=Pleomassaria siparia CBS 279.74 TaxID=1314801 RepID=A0A6G1KGJ8_9PLEO|nr:hypothetical protein K504DRAFT_531124 [Pleomassaria siparia CBS 279.74]
MTCTEFVHKFSTINISTHQKAAHEMGKGVKKYLERMNGNSRDSATLFMRPCQNAHHGCCTYQHASVSRLNMHRITCKFVDETYQARALHSKNNPISCPRTAKEVEDGEYNPAKEDVENVTAEHLNQEFKDGDSNAAEKRRFWLEQLESWDEETPFDSPHVQALTSLINYVVNHAQNKRIMVISQFLKYLDMVAAALSRRYNIKPLRFDGTVPQLKRGRIQEYEYAKSNARRMLMTAEWWNYSAEFQAIRRLWRQGQMDKVLVVKFRMENSAIDAEISRREDSYPDYSAIQRGQPDAVRCGSA